MKYELVYPMAVYVLFMWFSAIYTFRARVQSIKSGQVNPRFFKAQIGDPPPEQVVLAGRHYDNQFQVPVLFLITCVVHLQLGQANGLTLALAWVFVASRGVHSWILLGPNKLLARVATFAIGWLTVIGMWVQLISFAMKSSG